MSQQQITPEMRRRRDNLVRHWQAKYDAAAGDPAALVTVSYDRARAAARRAEKAGDTRAMHDLMVVLATWADQRELTQLRDSA